MTRSEEAIGIPILLYTHRKTHAQAIAECQEITALGDTWCNNANRYYSLQPDGQRQQRGIVELMDDMELLRYYDYDAVRLAIQQSNNRELIVYKTNTAVNMRTVASIRTQDMDNLAIFREIYGHGPYRQPRPAKPAVQDPRDPPDGERRDCGRNRDDKEQRKVDSGECET